jgi:hypothetical protein
MNKEANLYNEAGHSFTNSPIETLMHCLIGFASNRVAEIASSGGYAPNVSIRRATFEAHSLFSFPNLTTQKT